MMSPHSIAHTILNILEQCEATRISIGHAEGYFISSKQVSVLKESANTLLSEEAEAIYTPATTEIAPSTSLEEQVKGRLQEVHALIQRRQLELANAQSQQKPTINLELGKLWSELAKLNKLIKQFESLSA